MSAHRSPQPPRRRPLALAVTLAGAATGSVLLLHAALLSAQLVVGQPNARTPTQLLGCLCAAAAGLVLGWLALGGLVAALAGLPGRAGRSATELAVRLTPALLRSAVAAALGGSLAMSAITASANPAAGGLAGARPAATAPAATALALGSVPDSPGAAAHRTPALSGAPTTTAARRHVPPADVGLVSTRPAGRDDAGERGDQGDEVVVRRSDTLWSIAARHLGRGANAVEIAQEWPRWFNANRATIGPDPDHLVPGQRLLPPR